MSTNKLIAITIGPISRTTANVKSTKALWASSYFFSYLAKKLIAPFENNKFILPVVKTKDNTLWGNSSGIGRFPDRYMFYAEPGDFDKLKKHVQDTLSDDISDNMATFFAYSTNDEEEIKKEKKENLKPSIESFLKNYLKIYFFEKECASENPVEECNSILDLMELQDSYNLIESENYLTTFFEDKELRNSFLVTDAFGHNEKKQLFESLDKISEIELDNSTQERRAYHNYIAIISADGDNMSDTIKKLFEDEKNVSYKGESIQGLSEQLLHFGDEIVLYTDFRKKKVEYKARIVFLGGDDLLIFAPVMYKGKNVFDLINKISSIFNEKMSGFSNKPTLSFGVSINYTKYPMSEALQISRDMLEKAKEGNKNSVAFCLQKHSGRVDMGVYTKNPDKSIFDEFIKLINLYKPDKQPDDNRMLSSVMYWISNHETMLNYLLALNDNKAERIRNYFENSFNESIHSNLGGFYEKLTDFLVNAQQVTDDPIKLLYTSLRFIHFLKTKQDE